MTATLVTGGASGIGAALASAVAADGTQCVVVDIKEPRDPLPGIDYITADLASETGIQDMLTALSVRGIRQIQALVHCAAIAHYAPLRDTDRPIWERVLQVNLHGTIGLTQSLLPVMAPGGRIVLFASGTVFKGSKNLAAYVASKAGVIGFARCLADELGEQEITVNVISPGITATQMIEPMAHTEDANIATRALKRRAYPDDIVGPVKFLLSPDAAFVTGQTLCVDGGSVKR